MDEPSNEPEINVAGNTRRPTDGPPGMWRAVVFAVRLFLQGLLGWRVQARRPDVVPPPGQPLLVVFNHTSNVDAFLVAATLWRHMRHWVQPLVKIELFEAPGLGIVVRGAGAIPVVRGEGAGREAAYDAAVERLRDGGTVLLAPEATITHNGTLLPLRHGAARLALEAGVDVLVATHFGAQRGFSPVVRFAERGVVVTMAIDVLHPLPDEDAAGLTGRIAATMLDRSEELRATYPQADPDAPWWPPYSTPASPSATARENLERYQASMTDAIDQARQRMARLAGDHDVEQRITHARERAVAAAEDLSARSRATAEAFAEQSRLRVDELTEQGRQRVEELTEQGRQLAEELANLARERSAFIAEHMSATDADGSGAVRATRPHDADDGGDAPPVDPDAT